MDVRNGQDVVGDHKRCTRCNEVLPLDAFAPKPHLRSGRDSWCRPCMSAYQRAWRAKRKAAV